jgi:multidrug efflux pump subunit AcrB
MAVITVQYEVGEDPIQALVRLYDTIDSHRDWASPQLGVGEPIIKPKGIDDVPIVTLTFWTRDPPAPPSRCSRWRAPSNPR